MNDLISRQAAIDALGEEPEVWTGNECKTTVSTLYGYNIEHLALIARVLQKENLPPDRVAEALADIGRIVAIVRDEFEESLRKVVATIGAAIKNE